MITPVFAVLTSALPSGPALDAVPEWIHFYGDLRVRLEETLDNDVAGNDRMRGRLRARFGANFDISDEFKAEVRLTTLNPGDANNVNIDIGSTGEGQAGAEAGIDRMNVTWLPCDDWKFKAGKMGNPFAGNPVWNEYTWDGDIQPAGVFGQWDISDDLDVRLAHFVVTENSAAADASVTTAQVNFGMQGDNIDWALHSSVSNWSAEDGYLGSFGFVQTEDFMIWDTVVEASMDDLTVAAQYISNLDDDSGDDTGMVLGARYGRDKSAGSSIFSASYFDFDANAFVSAVGQDDTPIAGTGGPDGMNGFEASWMYWWKENVMLRFWVLQADNDTIDPLRLRFDLNVNFKR